MSNEVKVGLLFFVGLGLALWFTLFVGALGRPKGKFAIHFRRITLLREGDPVTYNGVRVGTVTQVQPELQDDGRALVVVMFMLEEKVRGRVLVDKETEYTISQGLLGGANLAITAVKGVPITPEALVGALGKEPIQIADAVASVHALIEENRPDIRASLSTLKETLQKFGDMSDEIRGLVKDNRPAVGEAVANFSKMSDRIAALVDENRDAIKSAVKNFDEMSKQIGDLVKENRDKLKEAIEKLPDAVENFKNAAKRIEDVVAENRDDIRATIKKLAEFAPRIDKISANLEVITTQIAEGKGTVGKLVFDDTLHENANQAMAKLNERLDEVKPLTSGLSDLKFYAGVKGGYNTDTGSGVGEAYLRIEPRPWKFYEAGASYRVAPADRRATAEDPDKLHIDINLLFGWRFFPDDDAEVYRLTVAGGLIESELGAIVQVPLYRDVLCWTTMARQKDNTRDPNDRRFEDGKAMLRSYLEYRPFRNYGIYLIAGGDDLIDHPAPWVGFSAELLDMDLRNITTATSLVH